MGINVSFLVSLAEIKRVQIVYYPSPTARVLTSVLDLRNLFVRFLFPFYCTTICVTVFNAKVLLKCDIQEAQTLRLLVPRRAVWLAMNL